MDLETIRALKRHYLEIITNELQKEDFGFCNIQMKHGNSYKIDGNADLVKTESVFSITFKHAAKDGSNYKIVIPVMNINVLVFHGDSRT